MLRKFSVSNFKNFESELTLDLSSGRYDFHKEYIKDKIDNIAIVYGYNASGKSNLMLAIFDIVATLTDKNKDLEDYISYQNVNHISAPAEFRYEFVFNGEVVDYAYSKSDYYTIVSECLKINGKKVIERKAGDPIITISLSGTDTLDRNLQSNKIAAVKYISANSNIPDTREGNVFKEFISFVNRMLLFWCLQERRYIGYENGTSNLLSSIAESGLLDEFNKFIKALNINRKIIKKKSPTGKLDFYYDFGKGNLLLYDNFTPSNGEKALLLFFYWYSKLQEESKPSIIAIDEFDAFYHINLAKALIQILAKSGSQVILTSHNPSLISNEILRPDCYFLLENGQISNFTNLTDKDIRQAQNLERMFRAGEFNIG